eukprot:m.812571 g.812571  ORF g.812571 m.812571 type:complete len:56 (+) comp59344_c0_seq2:4233-4400(+)
MFIHFSTRREEEAQGQIAEAWASSLAALDICDEDEWLHLHSLKLAASAQLLDASQ